MTAPETNESKNQPGGPAATPEAAAQARADAAAPAGLEEQLAAAKKEAADNYDRYLRAVADLENARKRAVREKDELRQYAATRILEDLIPVLDSLELGLAAAKQPNAEPMGIVSGVEMVINQLKNALAVNGMREIRPEGQLFDPHQHQAISHLPHPTMPAEHVITVVRTGYSLNSRLLRPASVVVSSGPVSTEAPQ